MKIRNGSYTYSVSSVHYRPATEGRMSLNSFWEPPRSLGLGSVAAAPSFPKVMELVGTFSPPPSFPGVLLHHSAASLHPSSSPFSLDGFYCLWSLTPFSCLFSAQFFWRETEGSWNGKTKYNIVYSLFILC